MGYKKMIPSLVIAVAVFVFSGCSSLQEAGQSFMEVPTLEKQANRVAIGMTIVRENNIMAKKMPISADAKWPKEVTAPLTPQEKQEIKRLLLQDPYFATVHFTERLQRQHLGSGALMNQLGGFGSIAAAALNQTITPLMYRAFYKIKIFYGPDPKNWPDIFDFDATKGNFEEFHNGKLIEIEALEGDVYPTITEALIALVPINLQKDVEDAKEEMLQAYSEVLDLKQELADIETKLKTDEAHQSATKNKVDLKEIAGIDTEYIPLTPEEKSALQEQKSVLEEQISVAEAKADEKEEVYFELLDQASIALQNDINLDDQTYIKLAQNINLVANEINDSATEAYTSFGIASTKILGEGIIQNFPKELKILALAKQQVPLNLQSKYDERIRRLVKNTMYILPNIFMGTYYAHKQATVAKKYLEFTDIILEAYNTKLEQEAAAMEAAAQEAQKTKEE
ncbi:MAG: hypothetical protein GXO11_00530 [Epsilonproteobacteria bacterium]|nr:hypothetical protein [Campylobacterota bacterium]